MSEPPARSCCTGYEYNPSVVTPTATTGNTDARRVYNLGNPQDAAYGGAVFSGITDQATAVEFQLPRIAGRVENQFLSRPDDGPFLHLEPRYRRCFRPPRQPGSSTGNIYNRRLDRGNSEFDVRHRYSGIFSAINCPGCRTSGAWSGHILGGWTVDWIQTFQTGLPFTISESNDRSLTSAGGNRPDYIGGACSVRRSAQQRLRQAKFLLRRNRRRYGHCGHQSVFPARGQRHTAAAGRRTLWQRWDAMFSTDPVSSIPISVGEELPGYRKSQLRDTRRGFQSLQPHQFHQPASAPPARNIASSSFGRITNCSGSPADPVHGYLQILTTSHQGATKGGSSDPPFFIDPSRA